MDVLCVFSCQRCIRCHSENGKGNDIRSERKISREEQMRLNGPVIHYKSSSAFTNILRTSYKLLNV